MSRHSWRRSPAPAVWALVAILGLPALAQAQLFPNASIHRKRVPCSQEPPVYKMYRDQFYGHYPTCWRRWPSGWGCPTPEAPPAWDIVQREEPVRSQRDVDVPSLDTGLPSTSGLPATELELPDGGSPFELPPSEGSRNNSAPASPSPFDLPGGTLPDAPAPPASEGSLFDLPAPSTVPPAGPQAGSYLPELSPPGESFDASAGLSPLPRDPEIPMMPAPTLPPGGEFAPIVVDQLPPPGTSFGADQRAPRRGVVAGMMDRLKSRLR